MSLRTPSPSIFRPAAGIDQSVLQENTKLLAEHRSPQDFARRPQPRRADHADRLRCDQPQRRAERSEGLFVSSTTASRP